MKHCLLRIRFSPIKNLLAAFSVLFLASSGYFLQHRADAQPARTQQGPSPLSAEIKRINALEKRLEQKLDKEVKSLHIWLWFLGATSLASSGLLIQALLVRRKSFSKTRKQLDHLDQRMNKLAERTSSILNRNPSLRPNEQHLSTYSITPGSREFDLFVREVSTRIFSELKIHLEEPVPKGGEYNQEWRAYNSDTLDPSPSPSNIDPIAEATQKYLSAVTENNRNQIRSLTQLELRVSDESEYQLGIGSIKNTQLQGVSTGSGSYLLMLAGPDKHVLFPSLQTLESYKTKQPKKGIFKYEESSSVPKAILKEPAEVELIHDDLWEVTKMGVVLVPNLVTH